MTPPSFPPHTPRHLGGAWWIPCRDVPHAVSEGARLVLDALVTAGEDDAALALSGGRVASALYAELVRQSAARRVRLNGTDLFWADERCVPPDHPESNFRLAREGLIDPLGLPPQRLHRLRGEEDPDHAAAAANADWDRWTARRARRGPHLDGVILGVGEDGHVASLFPGNLAADLPRREPFRAVTGPKPPPQRLTMGYPLLWSARRLVILALGPGKSEVVLASLTGRHETPLTHVLRPRPPGTSIVVTAEPAA